MNSYQRLFGTGPRGLIISLFLLDAAVFFEQKTGLPKITGWQTLRYTVFGVLTGITVIIILWSITSLSPADRGKRLISTGAFKYMRHPLYGAFLSFFNVGLAVLLNNWIYILWTVIQHPVWHWNIRGEEELMRKMFPSEYDRYCQNTGRFFPRF